MTGGLASSPFLAGAKLIEKARRADNSRQYKAAGYDLFANSRTVGAPRPLLSEREHRAVKQTWRFVGEDAQTGQ